MGQAWEDAVAKYKDKGNGEPFFPLSFSFFKLDFSDIEFFLFTFCAPLRYSALFCYSTLF